MAQGKPVVAFDCGGVRQWLEHERTGFAVPHGDTAEYARRIDQLIGNDILRAEMGARARAAVSDRFSPEAYIRSLLGIYTEVLNESSAYRSGGRTEIRDPQCGISVPV
jgi:glycosyltransferase involved in cell wall biosynthesis